MLQETVPGVEPKISMRLTRRRGRTRRGRWSDCSWRFLNSRSTRGNWSSRGSGDTRRGVKRLGRILGLNRQRGRHLAVRLIRMHINFELSFAGFLHFGLKIRTRRSDFDVFHVEIFPGMDVDCLRVRFVPLLPEHKSRTDLQFLWNDSFESEDGFLIGGLVRLHCHGFDLCAGAIADVEGSRNLAFLPWPNLLLLSLRSSATAGRVNRFKMNRGLADVLIFEMTDSLFVAARRMKFNGSLLPFQFSARTQAKNNRQGKSENLGFHLFE